jgi:hypothetical protein
LVKAALQEAKTLSPDGIQSVAFPKGVTVQLVAAEAQGGREASLPKPPRPNWRSG